MLSGLKFIPRDQIDAEQDDNVDVSRKERKKLGRGKEKNRRERNTSRYGSSGDDLERIDKRSRKKKKWYSSDEDLSLDSSESESEKEKKSRNRKKVKKRNEDSSEDEARGRSRKKSKSKKKDYSSEGYSSHDSHSDDGDGHSSRQGKKKRSKKVKKRGSKKSDLEEDLRDDDGGSHSLNAPDIIRKEMGLEWMLRPNDNVEKTTLIPSDNQPDEPPAETKRSNPRELNPYLKDNGSGFPEEANGEKAGGSQLLSSSVVGDGGASWRLKALKRAQEQAAREGRKLDEVVGERWDSLGQLTVSVSSHAAAPSRAHLHAIQNRKKALTEGQQTRTDNQNDKNIGRERSRDASMRHPQMRVPKLHDSLSWGKQKSQKVSTKDAGLISSAVSSINKFSNDGSFIRDVMRQQNDKFGGSLGSSYTKGEKEVEPELVHPDSEMRSGDGANANQALSANQLAAKALQLRMKGNHEEAAKLMEEVENIKLKETARAESIRQQNVGTTGRHMMHDVSIRQKKKEEDADMHLAQKIVENKRYSISGRADDEYDFDDGPRRKSHKKEAANDRKPTQTTNIGTRILTQQERCQFCFENPKRPRHLTVSIANFSYLTLPHWQPVVPGHCCILPMQHESATRSVDNNVWGEIRNFKKCLIMMFAKQDKEPVFLETVMGLAQQRRHCLVDCIPLPRETAKQAPLYFKKAIDEAEDEWSQHNAKKLIDTTEKGLRGSIPKDFPYFYVEFGLDKGFVHVIDDETNFKNNFGLNVVRGMLRLPEEDMYRRRKHDSVDTQKESRASFAQNWEPFDWTKQLD